MGHLELIKALHREGEAKCAAVTAKYEAEAARLRREADSRLEDLRQEQEQKCQFLCAARHREFVGAAEKEARLLRLRAEHELAERLRQRGAANLPGLRGEGYPRLFQLMAGELAWGEWGRVSVNPADVALASGGFPGAEIVADDAISGGFLAVSVAGDLTVASTLESRLERLWPDLLPLAAAPLLGEAT